MEVGFDDLIKRYPSVVRENAYLMRELILGMFGQIEEQIDSEAGLARFILGQGYKNTLCTIIPSQKAIKLGFYRGTEINIPECLLEGEGRMHRYALITDFYDQQLYLKYLLKEAFKIWQTR